MTVFDQLVEIANAMGCTVKFSKQLRNYFGQYDKYDSTIILSTHNLKTRQDKLTTLAHEIGHAYYRHSISAAAMRAFHTNGISRGQRYRLIKQEKDAWEYATFLARWFGFYTKKFQKSMDDGITCATEEYKGW